MPYFPVDDDMPFHPKVLAAGNEAIGLWTRAGALCKKHTTGGFVSAETVRSLGSKRLAERLVTAGLWVAVDGGYRFHDWTKQAGNGTAEEEKAQLERARERNAARQRAFRERHGSGNAVTNAPVTDTPSPSPNRLTGDTESRHEVGTSVATDSMLPPAIRALASQAGITSVEAIVEAIAKHTGRAVPADRAVTVARHLLSKARTEPRAPQRYVIGAISRSPFEVQKYIDENGLAA